MVKKINLSFNESGFRDFLNKVNDLSRLSDTLKLKIDSDNILIYSMIGSENVTLAFKSYLLKTSDYIIGLENLDNLLNIIIPYSKKFSKNLDFIDDSKGIKFDLNYVEDSETDEFQSRSFTIKSGKLKLNIQCGEVNEIKDLNKSVLSKRLDPTKRKWGFGVDIEDFKTIKKLSQINSSSEEMRKILELSTDNDIVKISEVPIWELEVAKVRDIGNKNLLFNKSYLSFVNECELIEFNIFDTFILIKDSISDLMISFETNFED